MNRHVNYVVTWCTVLAGGDPSHATTIEQATTTAKKFTWMPTNTVGTLYTCVPQMNLGYSQTDEFEYTFKGIAYIAKCTISAWSTK